MHRDLFIQNGMDFVTEISYCKTPVVDEVAYELPCRVGELEGPSKTPRKYVYLYFPILRDFFNTYYVLVLCIFQRF